MYNLRALFFFFPQCFYSFLCTLKICSAAKLLSSWLLCASFSLYDICSVTVPRSLERAVSETHFRPCQQTAKIWHFWQLTGAAHVGFPTSTILPVLTFFGRNFSRVWKSKLQSWLLRLLHRPFSPNGSLNTSWDHLFYILQHLCHLWRAQPCLSIPTEAAITLPVLTFDCCMA